MILYNPVFANSQNLETLVKLPTLTPFGVTVTDFVDEFSKRLLLSAEIRNYPEIAALAFWMRRGSINRLRKTALSENRLFAPRGVAFHVAPANVDTIFVYSWFLSVLCGNSNIVRVSSKSSIQVSFLFDTMQLLFSENKYKPIFERSLVVRYGHDSQVNNLFSSKCDIRLIWGGDETINEIRKSPLPSTSCEMTFANKYSFSVIDSEAFVRASVDQVIKWVDAFYNDAYWFAQMACSSPRMILWNGLNDQYIYAARERFWSFLEKRLGNDDTGLDISDYVNKKVAVDSLALHEKISIVKTANNDITRIWLEKPELHDNLHCGAGLFFESVIRGLSGLLPLLSRKIQTVSYIGISHEKWNAFLNENNVAGIDRIVPVGKALDFDYIWDGYDMPRMLMREISIK